jgi:hypothetical protein
VLASGVFEKFAALLDKDLLLCATAFIAQPAKSAVTRQKMNVPTIVNFAVRSPELFGWAAVPQYKKLQALKITPVLHKNSI